MLKFWFACDIMNNTGDNLPDKSELKRVISITAKDAFNSACELLNAKYKKYGFKYIKSKKQIRGNINGAVIYIDINTSRDNSSDYFVAFNPRGRIEKNGELICFLLAPERNDEQLFGENLIIDVSKNNKDMPEEYRKMIPDSIVTRMWTGPYFHCWNVAYPEQQKKAVEEAALWFDEKLFSNEQVINAIGIKIKSE